MSTLRSTLLLPALLLTTAIAAAAAAADSRADRVIAFYHERGGRPGDFYTLTLLADAYLEKGRATGDPDAYAAAAAAAAHALTLRPDYVPALVALAATEIAQHRFGDALSTARRATAADGTAADGHAVLGDALLEIGDLAAASTAYETFARLAPGLHSLARQAEWRDATGDDAGAGDGWTRAIDVGERQDAPPAAIAWAYVRRGAHHFAHGRVAEAEADYRAAIARDPGRYDAEVRLAEVQAATERFDEARGRYLRLAERGARPELWQEIGDFYLFIGRADEARAWHDRAEAAYLRAAEQGDRRYDHHLAVFYTDVRPRPAEAVAWARKDLARRHPSAAWDALAWALYINGERTAARAAIETALASGTTAAHVLCHAAVIYAGDGARGVDFLRAAYASNPRFDRFHAHR